MAEHIGKRIARWRERAGLKQAHLAALIDKVPSTVNHWETGNSSPQHETLEAVVSAIGGALGRELSMAEFWSDDEETAAAN